MTSTLRPLMAEFLGTFALVFIGAGSVVMDSATGGALGLVGIALASALVYAVMVTATMGISGGHINPAVTVGLWIAKRIDTRLGGLYIVAQLAAAVAAALLVRWLFPAYAGDVTSLGTPKISTDLGLLQGIVIEALLTFFLLCAVFGTLVSSDAPKVGGFAIGMVLLFGLLAAGPLTGAAMNPARAFGPAVIAGDFEGHPAYWIGPIIGAVVAGIGWGKILLPKGSPS